MWIPARLTVPPARTAASATGTSSPAGANTTARSHHLRRWVGGCTDPHGAEIARQRTMALASCHHHDVATPVLQDLQGEVRRRAEAQQCDSISGRDLGPTERPVSDDPRAQERRGLEVSEIRRGAALHTASGTVTASA